MVHDSGDNQNADRFPAESWTASRGITGPLPLESPDHIDRNTHPTPMPVIQETKRTVEFTPSPMPKNVFPETRKQPRLI